MFAPNLTWLAGKSPWANMIEETLWLQQGEKLVTPHWQLQAAFFTFGAAAKWARGSSFPMDKGFQRRNHPIGIYGKHSGNKLILYQMYIGLVSVVFNHQKRKFNQAHTDTNICIWLVYEHGLDLLDNRCTRLESFSKFPTTLPPNSWLCDYIQFIRFRLFFPANVWSQLQAGETHKVRSWFCIFW